MISILAIRSYMQFIIITKLFSLRLYAYIHTKHKFISLIIRMHYALILAQNATEFRKANRIRQSVPLTLHNDFKSATGCHRDVT